MLYKACKEDFSEECIIVCDRVVPTMDESRVAYSVTPSLSLLHMSQIVGQASVGVDNARYLPAGMSCTCSLRFPRSTSPRV